MRGARRVRKGRGTGGHRPCSRACARGAGAGSFRDRGSRTRQDERARAGARPGRGLHGRDRPRAGDGGDATFRHRQRSLARGRSRLAPRRFQGRDLEGPGCASGVLLHHTAPPRAPVGTRADPARRPPLGRPGFASAGLIPEPPAGLAAGRPCGHAAAVAEGGSRPRPPPRPARPGAAGAAHASQPPRGHRSAHRAHGRGASGGNERPGVGGERRQSAFSRRDRAPPSGRTQPGRARRTR